MDSDNDDYNFTNGSNDDDSDDDSISNLAVDSVYLCEEHNKIMKRLCRF